MTKNVNELEMKIAFLEDAIEKLSDEFYQQLVLITDSFVKIAWNLLLFRSLS